MRKLTVILALAILVLVFMAGWQIGACEVADIQLREDMKDLATQLGGRIGFSTPQSDDDFRAAVVAKAKLQHRAWTPAADGSAHGGRCQRDDLPFQKLQRRLFEFQVSPTWDWEKTPARNRKRIYGLGTIRW
jgi:hypothetical protein